MLTKIGVLGVLSTAMLGVAPLPTWAGSNHNQAATVQSTSQQATVTGDNNQVIQVINQITINHPGQGNLKRALNPTAIVQDAAQGVTVNGQAHQAVQTTTQVNQRPQGNGQGRGNDRAVGNQGNGHARRHDRK